MYNRNKNEIHKRNIEIFNNLLYELIKNDDELIKNNDELIKNNVKNIKNFTLQFVYNFMNIKNSENFKNNFTLEYELYIYILTEFDYYYKIDDNLIDFLVIIIYKFLIINNEIIHYIRIKNFLKYWVNMSPNKKEQEKINKDILNFTNEEIFIKKIIELHNRKKNNSFFNYRNL